MSTIEVLSPVGRVVQGHPMRMDVVKDEITKIPKMQKDGVTPQTSAYIALAITKGPEQHWNQTAWGSELFKAGTEAWPNGEFNAPTFSWKIEDGDSQIPNKKGKKNCDKIGHPGHWIVKLSTGIPLKCFHAGAYQPHEVIQNENEIKTGDYARVLIRAKGNGSSQSPGVYLNPELFELSRAGELIVSEGGADAMATFGGGITPQAAQLAPYVAPAVPVVAAPAGQVTPAPDFLNAPVAPAAPAPIAVEKSYIVNGSPFTETALRAAGYTDAHFATLPVAWA